MTTIETTPHAPLPELLEPNETVHIVAWRLYDYDGETLTYGGLQRWLLALIDLLADHGHPVVVHQRAHRGFEKTLRSGVTLRGHKSSTRATGTPWFNVAVHKQIPAQAPVVYMVEDVSFPHCRERSLVVQHGVWWDGEFGILKRRATELMVRRAVRRAAAVVCVDTNFINWYRARYPADDFDAKFHFVPNFLDPGEFGPQPEVPAAAVAEAAPIDICFPRRSEPRRGIGLIGDVAPGILRRFPAARFRFIVGSGYYTDELRDRLLAADADPTRWSIEILPFDRMREAYERSAIVTIPTVCGEGTALAAIEAMYFGCAVISTWVGGLPNLIQDERTGLLIPPTRPALAESIARLIEDDALRVELGRNAMASVLPGHGLDLWRQRMTRLLTEQLSICSTEVQR